MIFTGTGIQNTGEWPLKPKSIEAVLKNRDSRFGVLALASIEPTDTADSEYHLLDGSALEPEWIGEGDAAPLVKASYTAVTVTAKKLAATLGLTQEVMQDAAIDPEAFERTQILPGFAKKLSAALLGQSGATDVNVFTRNMRDIIPTDADHQVVIGTANTKYRDAAAAAENLLVSRGVNANGAVWHATAHEELNTRKARDGAGETSALLYNELNDLSGGLRTAIDINLPASGLSAVIGYVGDFESLKLKVYKNLEVEESAGAKDNAGNILFSGQNGMRFYVFRMRAAGGVVNPASFVRIVNPAA